MGSYHKLIMFYKDLILISEVLRVLRVLCGFMMLRRRVWHIGMFLVLFSPSFRFPCLPDEEDESPNLFGLLDCFRSITYVPGLYKIVDEILVNAADNKVCWINLFPPSRHY